MSVYFVVQEKVTDPDGLAAYGKAAGPSMRGIRGRAVAVDNDVTSIEGGVARLAGGDPRV